MKKNSDFRYWFNKASALVRLKKYDDAIECFDKAIELNPNLHLLWYFKGKVLVELNRYDESIEYLDKACSIEPVNNDKIRNYNELDVDEKEVIDAFRQMKLISDYNRFKLYKYKVENLINDYEQLKKLRQEIQVNYFSIYEELLAEDLIDGELDASIWGITREHENEVWDSELRLMADIKTNFDIAIAMIESGEAEQVIIDEENK